MIWFKRSLVCRPLYPWMMTRTSVAEGVDADHPPEFKTKEDRCTYELDRHSLTRCRFRCRPLCCAVAGLEFCVISSEGLQGCDRNHNHFRSDRTHQHTHARPLARQVARPARRAQNRCETRVTFRSHDMVTQTSSTVKIWPLAPMETRVGIRTVSGSRRRV
jgi:hypothetical protein